jgi:hypothetical protein
VTLTSGLSVFVLCRRFRHHSEAGAGISTMIVDET